MELKYTINVFPAQIFVCVATLVCVCHITALKYKNILIIFIKDVCSEISLPLLLTVSNQYQS